MSTIKITSSATGVDALVFKNKLATYKKDIDAELERIITSLLTDTSEQFGQYPLEVVQSFTNVLQRGGKRIRGALAIATYEMFGGTDKAMIVRAACALEILNTYMLVADDIQDRSETRRGGPTAHMQLKEYHQQHHLKGDSQHFGEATAISGFLIAQHYASNIILNLSVSAERRLQAQQNINRCFVVTGHGQTLDIFNEAAEATSKQDINNVLVWKTAYYTFINPMQLGAILAGASREDIEQLAQYGSNAGRAFQIIDDIIGTFGVESETGKSPLDDIKEGKRTLLVINALELAQPSDAYFLTSCLGNQDLTQSDFNQCQSIIKSSGALEVTKKEAETSAVAAIAALENHQSWDKISRDFFAALVQYVLVRKS